MRQQDSELGLQIKLARVALRIRQRELAATVGIAASVLSDVENGWRRPSEDLLKRISQALEIPIDQLREGP